LTCQVNWYIIISGNLIGVIEIKTINKFREKRLQASIAQEEVAKKLGIGQSTVSAWETGESHPRAEMLPKIAKIYGCTIDDLFLCQKNEDE
jgi:Predicted transcriptional regulators